MSFTVTHLYGDMERDPPLESLPALFAELEERDWEHTDVSVTHESGWGLSAFGGLLVWENIEEAEARPRHMKNVSRERVLELWEKLARGEIDEIHGENWREGYY